MRVVQVLEERVHCLDIDRVYSNAASTHVDTFTTDFGPVRTLRIRGPSNSFGREVQDIRN